MDRRQFLKGAALSVPAAIAGNSFFPSTEAFAVLNNLKYKILVPEIYASIPRPPAHTTAIVVGSGFGGAISALRLAQAGITTTILERGLRWPNDPKRQIFASDALPDGRGYWQKTQVVQLTGLPYFFDYFNGVFDVTKFENIDVWRAACVGGGSVVFTGVMIQPKKTYFEQIFGDLVSWQDMDTVYYPRVRKMLNLSPMPSAIYKTAPFGHSRVWDADVAKAGYESMPVDSIFNWNVVQNELDGRVRPSAIIGESNLGNSNSAKFDLNLNYLKEAEATGKAKIYPCHEVTEIGFDGQKYSVSTIKYAPDGTVVDRYTLTSDYLFLAAGSIGSSQLMVSARDTGKLSGLNEHVGEGWGTNGDTTVVRSFDKIKGLVQGAPCASMIHDDNGLPFTMENWYTPAMPLNVGIIGSLGMGFDTKNRGKFVYSQDKRKSMLQWPANGNDEVVARARQINNKIASATLTIPGATPFAKDVDASWTAHPLGGLVLGKATDKYGRLHGYKRLYAMDGAIIPGTTGAVNPSLTISALAERNIEGILKEDF